MWWYTSSRFSTLKLFGKHFLCTDDDCSWCLSLLADCEGRSWRDISNSFIYLDLAVHVTHDSLVIIKVPHTFSQIFYFKIRLIALGQPEYIANLPYANVKSYRSTIGHRLAPNCIVLILVGLVYCRVGLRLTRTLLFIIYVGLKSTGTEMQTD